MLKIKVFDEMHEKDLENEINLFIKNNPKIEINDIKFQVAVAVNKDEQIFCFSAIIIYEEISKMFIKNGEVSNE